MAFLAGAAAPTLRLRVGRHPGRVRYVDAARIFQRCRRISELSFAMSSPPGLSPVTDRTAMTAA
jgi:hypothetical protein